ncbi:hypothetical protein [Aestuariibaculum suncheonense]|uniref:Uncharacterized protein n=1 Tax=Aestuariibaculum suncheonense TaxID=1028745 RepID=A0A8J6ULA5_9FLAO|nr:hypothetical protein [Aestuariibaculum suncheonense]MBD0836221.1 hypothetical protein [Aestuariibaculum suncheonense]
MKKLRYLLAFISLSIYSQEYVETAFIKDTKLEADRFISVSSFEATFYIFDNVLFKQEKNSKGIDVGYNNFQLGNITSVNTFNPLKINLFYKDFNTVVILDNRMAEISKIDFNALEEQKYITHVSTGYDNTLWVFNQNNQQLELFDYNTETTRVTSMPIQSPVLDIKSNYNTCWVLTEKYLYVYNYFGSLVKKIKNKGYTTFEQSNANIILKKDNSLFFLKNTSDDIIPIKLPNLLINAFFVTNETLYIYDNETLHEYQIKTI